MLHFCRTEYESECWTKQEEHDVEDDVVTCKTVQVEIHIIFIRHEQGASIFTTVRNTAGCFFLLKNINLLSNMHKNKTKIGQKISVFRL